MHAEAFAFVRHTLTQHPCAPDAFVVEIGGLDINGTVRGLFPPHYLSTDVTDGPGVDRVADGATLTLDQPADVVVCCEVLEHAPHAQAIVANMARIASPGGRLIITAAGADGDWARLPHSAVDGGDVRDGEHYANVSPGALSAWLREAGCTDVKVWVNPSAGDVYATARTPAWEPYA